MVKGEGFIEYGIPAVRVVSVALFLMAFSRYGLIL